jgi:hypothetical protein
MNELGELYHRHSSSRPLTDFFCHQRRITAYYLEPSLGTHGVHYSPVPSITVLHCNKATLACCHRAHTHRKHLITSSKTAARHATNSRRELAPERLKSQIQEKHFLYLPISGKPRSWARMWALSLFQQLGLGRNVHCSDSRVQHYKRLTSCFSSLLLKSSATLTQTNNSCRTCKIPADDLPKCQVQTLKNWL